jgi:heme A synthase
MRRFLKQNSLSIVFLLLFLAALGGQAIAGHADFNEQQTLHGDPEISLGRYVVSSEYAVDVMENWQSEYLQFTLFVLLTVLLLQRGSPESKELDKAGGESDEEQKVGEHAQRNSPLWAKVGGIRRKIYENSLLIVMGAIWIGTWVAQSIAGLAQYNSELLDHQLDTVSWLSYVSRPDFWNRTLQNWQSEFLAVGSFAILAVYLRQRGSPESKPVGAPHGATGVEG